MMRTADYIFERAVGTIPAMISGNATGTDAINALEKWVAAAGRGYEIRAESEEAIRVTLTFDDTDGNAGTALDHCCIDAGVQRKLDEETE